MTSSKAQKFHEWVLEFNNEKAESFVRHYSFDDSVIKNDVDYVRVVPKQAYQQLEKELSKANEYLQAEKEGKDKKFKQVLELQAELDIMDKNLIERNEIILKLEKELQEFHEKGLAVYGRKIELLNKTIMELKKELKETNEEIRIRNEALEKIRKIAKDIPGKGTIQALYILDAIDEATKQWTATDVNYGKE